VEFRSIKCCLTEKQHLQGFVQVLFSYKNTKGNFQFSNMTTRNFFVCKIDFKVNQRDKICIHEELFSVLLCLNEVEFRFQLSLDKYIINAREKTTQRPKNKTNRRQIEWSMAAVLISVDWQGFKRRNETTKAPQRRTPNANIENNRRTENDCLKMSYFKWIFLEQQRNLEIHWDHIFSFNYKK